MPYLSILREQHRMPLLKNNQNQITLLKKVFQTSCYESDYVNFLNSINYLKIKEILQAGS